VERFDNEGEGCLEREKKILCGFEVPLRGWGAICLEKSHDGKRLGRKGKGGTGMMVNEVGEEKVAMGLSYLRVL